MMTMSQQETIRELWQNGKNESEISDILKIDRKTVHKYVTKEDFMEGLEKHVSKPHGSKLDPYKEIIDSKLEEQKNYYHKQKFTAKRMYTYLCDDLGIKELEGSYQTVQRYVRHWKNVQKRNGYSEPGTMPLVWHAGEAQCDFGEADFSEPGGKLKRRKYLILSFPNSNRLTSVVMPGENCECVCQGLQYIFDFIGKVPFRIVFDNATGIGKRLSGVLQENESFTRFRMHYGFTATYCNPQAGYEKGNVENAVGTFRRNFMVPPQQINGSLQDFNSEVMLPNSFAFRADEQHYKKGKTVKELFQEDLKAMNALPKDPFKVSTYSKYRLNNVGKFVMDSNNGYNLGPSHSGETIIVEKTAWNVICYTTEGKKIKQFERAYGSEIAESYDLESILNSMSGKPNSWRNSIVREQMSEGAFKDYLDNAEFKERRSALFMFALISDEYGFGNASYALNRLAGNGHIPTKEDARIFCERVVSFPNAIPDNPTNVSLSEYDALLNKEVCHAVC